MARRFWPHLAIGAAAVLFLLNPGSSAQTLLRAADLFLSHFGRLTLWSATLCVVICLGLALSPRGRERIGGEGARPEFSAGTWLSMLFAAGMGPGLVFWGAAEPLIHVLSPPPTGIAGGIEDPAARSYAITQFHWSLHAWSIYAVAALAVALSTRKGEMPLPSAPLGRLGPKARRVVDWTALAAVLFGVVASLSAGVLQMGAGAARIAPGIGSGVGVQLALLALLVAAYSVSAVSGLTKGIATLSVINVALALLLAAFVALAGPTGAILSAAGTTLIAYVRALPELSVALASGGETRAWSEAWSLTYFLWWVAWTPFVGVFVARISRGRTVRQFLAGVILVPAAATWLWFAVFGGAAVALDLAGADFAVSDFDSAPQATYALLGELPLAAAAQTLTLVLVFLFLVTSADSGAYVLGMFSFGRGEPGVGERVYWGLVLAALTFVAILSEEGVPVTRAFAVVGSIPLLFLLGAQLVSLFRRLGRPSGGEGARRGSAARPKAPQTRASQNSLSKKSSSAPGSEA